MKEEENVSVWQIDEQSVPDFTHRKALSIRRAVGPDVESTSSIVNERKVWRIYTKNESLTTKLKVYMEANYPNIHSFSCLPKMAAGF